MCEHVPYMLLNRSDSATLSCASIFFSFKGIYVLLFFFLMTLFQAPEQRCCFLDADRLCLGGVVNLH